MLPRRIFGALPYQHTPREKLNSAFKLLSKHGLSPESSSSHSKRLKFVDLGSGAGEAVLMASRKGFDALGVGEFKSSKRVRAHSTHPTTISPIGLRFARRRDQPHPACHFACIAPFHSNFSWRCTIFILKPSHSPLLEF